MSPASGVGSGVGLGPMDGDAPIDGDAPLALGERDAVGADARRRTWKNRGAVLATEDEIGAHPTDEQEECEKGEQWRPPATPGLGGGRAPVAVGAPPREAGAGPRAPRSG